MIKNDDLKKLPIWQIKKKMRKLQFELKMLQKDPGTTHDEISEIDYQISQLKTEYARRRMKLEKLRKGVVS